MELTTFQPIRATNTSSRTRSKQIRREEINTALFKETLRLAFPRFETE